MQVADTLSKDIAKKIVPMTKRDVAKTDSDEELDVWVANDLAATASVWRPPLEADLGVRPADEDVWRIAKLAEDYVAIHRYVVAQDGWRKACKRVDRAALAFKAAIADSAKYYGNLVNAWEKEPGADRAVMRLQGLARRLAEGPRGKKSKLNRPLRPLALAVLQAWQNAGETGLGISTDPITKRLFGPVLEAVKTGLRLAGVPERELPSDSTIRAAAREVDRKGK